jgi:ribosomal-protein-alanine N-acetyltransferase
MANPIADAVANVVPTLESPRVRLRAYRASDAEGMFRLYSDPRVMRYWSFPPWTQIGQARSYLERVAGELSAGSNVLPWAIATRDDDCLVGTVTLFSLSLEQGRAETGYSLHPDFQGRGLAREGLSLALGHAFDALQLRRIEADVDPRNLPSCRLVEGLGFRREGLLRARWKVAGELCDSALYGLLAEDFARESTVRSEAKLITP